MRGAGVRVRAPQPPDATGDGAAATDSSTTGIEDIHAQEASPVTRPQRNKLLYTRHERVLAKVSQRTASIRICRGGSRSLESAAQILYASLTGPVQ